MTTTIRVHSLPHARTALNAARDAGKPVRLISPQLSQAGIGWWREMVRIARAEFPDAAFEAVVECGPAAGLALAAIRAGLGPVRLCVAADQLAKIASIAEQAGTRAEGGGEVTLDLLGVPDSGLACGKVLES